MKEIAVAAPSGAYPVKIGRGLLESAAQEIRQVCPGEKMALVTDETVAPLYAASLQKQLEALGYRVFLITVPPGEGSKSLSALEKLYDALARAGFTRSDAVSALGGGVVGDLAGFAAATMLRGLPLVQIPTTLLAQLDSSVGGKTAVNLPQGKNLVGAVYQPRLVLADPDCLSTLPPRQLSVGAAEAIKMGFAADESILRELESDTPRWETVIAAAVAAKAAVVAADEWDKGRRQILNFGHTLGHVYEAAGGCLHGEAVAAGMMKMLELEERWGEPTAALRERLAALLRRYELPAELPCGAETYRRYLPLDKKCRDGVITLVQVRRCGRTELRKMDVEALLEALAVGQGKE